MPSDIAPATATAARETGPLYLLKLAFVRAGVLPWFLVISIVLLTLSTDSFMTTNNVTTVARQSTYLILASMAQMLVLLTRGLDLSLGTMFAMCSVITSMVMVNLSGGDSSAWFAITMGILAGMGTCMLIGAANGIGVAYLSVPPFVMTLAMSSIVSGFAFYITGGTPVYGMPFEFSEVFGYGKLFGVAVPIIVTAVIIGIVYLYINWTRMGRYLYAIGGNPKASELSGINTKFHLLLTYTIASAITGVSALLLTARLESGESNIGVEYPLLSIAACAIGGVSLFGGVGKLRNVVLGAVFIILVQNGMNLLQLNSYLQLVVIGILLILAVVADNYRLKLLLTMAD